MKIIYIFIAVLLSLIAGSITFAGGNHAHKHDHAHGANDSSVVGKPGKLENVSHTIELQMTFKHFRPSKIDVKQGETIKFILKNTSNKEHEIMIGTMDELKAHAKEMRNNPNWAHVDPDQVTVGPDETGELIWEFTKAGTVPFACPRHGHFKAMRGEINVAAQ